jgi:energy-coupling factor transport system ATP-binding protein
VIDARNLCFRYSGSSRDAVHNVALSLEPGGYTAILGANGSGKSTLALMLAGLLTPAAGTVAVDGFSAELPEGRREITKRVGIVFQDPNAQFTSPSVERELAFGLQNMAMPSGDMNTAVDEYLRRFDLEQYRSLHPADLSGGEQQRLAFASVLITRPRYLVLDEPATLLPPRSKERMFETVASLRLAASPGILLITQSPRDALAADQVIVLHEGQVRFSSTPGELLAHADLLERCNIPVPLRFRSFS